MSDGGILAVVTIASGLAWLGLLTGISLAIALVHNGKQMAIEPFLRWSIRVGMITGAALTTLMLVAWLIYEWKPSLGFFGPWIRPYLTLIEAGGILGIAWMTVLLSLLRARGKKRRS